MPAVFLAAGAEAQSLRELQFLEDSYTHAILHAPPAPDENTERRWREHSCSPEADLSGRGRLVAMAAGDSIQRAGTRIDHVLASPSCSAVATARMLELVPVDVEEFLAPEPPDEQTAEDQRNDAIFYLARLRPSETALLVTHGRNIAELTGVETVPGQMLIVTVDPLGELVVRFSVGH